MVAAFEPQRLVIQKSSVRPVFTVPAFLAIYLSTGGFPRKIINLCHQSMLAMIVQNRTKAGWFLIRSCAGRTLAGRPIKSKLPLTIGLSALLIVCAVAVRICNRISFLESKCVRAATDVPPNVNLFRQRFPVRLKKKKNRPLRNGRPGKKSLSSQKYCSDERNGTGAAGPICHPERGIPWFDCMEGVWTLRSGNAEKNNRGQSSHRQCG